MQEGRKSRKVPAARRSRAVLAACSQQQLLAPRAAAGGWGRAAAAAAPRWGSSPALTTAAAETFQPEDARRLCQQPASTFWRIAPMSRGKRSCSFLNLPGVTPGRAEAESHDPGGQKTRAHGSVRVGAAWRGGRQLGCPRGSPPHSCPQISDAPVAAAPRSPGGAGPLLPSCQLRRLSWLLGAQFNLI